MKIPTNEGELIKEGLDVKPTFNKNIDGAIFQKGYVQSYIDKSGLFVIPQNGQFLFDKLTNYFTNRIINKFNFKKITLPKMSPVSTYKKADVIGKWDFYLEKVIPFSETNGVKEEFILEPLQCIPFYQLLEGKEIRTPMKVFDCSGPTYRNENLDKIKPLIKQREFHRAEFVYLGSKKQVIGLREAIIKEITKILDEFEMKYRIVVGTGCFEISKKEIVFPKSISEIPIKDIEIFIPGTNSWLEVCGCSVLWDVQTKRFNITSRKVKELWSGCVGIGLERLMYAFLAQKGFNKNKWPKDLLK